MRRTVLLPVLVAGAVAALCSTLPAFGDIKSFNVAMQTKDYGKATAEAAATWPTLDKSRKDLAVIAREFGFAAYLSGDYAAARTYGEAAMAVGETVGEEAGLRSGSEILARLAAFKLAASEKSRDDLYAALVTRATFPGVDLITFFAADTQMHYDFDKGSWKKAAESAALAETLASEGGGPYLLPSFRFALYKSVAAYLDQHKVEPYKQLAELETRLSKAIDAAPSDEAAEDLVQLFWGVLAWENSLYTHLSDRQKLRPEDKQETRSEAPSKGSRTERLRRLQGLRKPDDPCQTETIFRRTPSYPIDELYKGTIGTVIASADFDEKGVASNPKILAAVPTDAFGKAVLGSLAKVRVAPGKNWNTACTLAQNGKVVMFVFSIG